ncbi:MAG: MFS transporter, partial [Acidimicrobiales bacterium]
GWREALALWAVPAAAGVALWTTRLAGSHRDIDAVHVSGRLWRDPLAWQVTAFMGLQSLGFYATLAWLPTIFEQHGVAPTPAGWLLSLAGIASLPAAFAAPVLGSSPARQRVVLVGVAGLNALALAGLLWRPVAGSAAWMVLLGLAQGAALSLALSFIVLRAPNAARAAELSGMAQSVGYLLAGLGPSAVGAVRQYTGGWVWPLALLAIFLFPELAAGLAASRPLVVGERGAPGG